MCSSFLAMICFLVEDCTILPKKELHRSLQVVSVALSPKSSGDMEPGQTARPGNLHRLGDAQSSVHCGSGGSSGGAVGKRALPLGPKTRHPVVFRP